MYMCIYWFYLEILWIYRKFHFFKLYWLLLNHKDGKIWRIWFNYGIGCKHAGFHSLRPMGSNLMNEHNFKQLLVLEVCHWPWANIHVYHEHNLSSWYGKGIHFLYSCKISLEVVMFVVLLDFLWIFFSRQKEGPASMILLEPSIRGCSLSTSGCFH